MSLRKVKIACIGDATAKSLGAFGLKATLVPEDYKQEGLIKAFQKLPLNGEKMLFARAREGRDLLIRFLHTKKAKVDLLALYENRIPRDARGRLRRLFLKEGGVDLVTFASSSSVDHFYSLFTPNQKRQWLRLLPVAVIGPVTASAVRKWGGRVAVQPKSYTLPALVQAIAKWYKSKRR